MKKFVSLLFIATVFCIVLSEDYLTIYNNNQGLFKTNIELDLQRGIQYHSIENIPTSIVRESVIFLPNDSNVNLFSQNFEYDLADSQKMLRKYIDKNVKIYTDDEMFQGTLMFFDNRSYGLLNETTNELHIINAPRVNNIFLSEMPDDFYTKPTLRWQLAANRAGKYQADLSYLTGGIQWRATYNAVIRKNDFTLNSWVTINNTSGKDYRNVNLKLIAGEVQTHQNLANRSSSQQLIVREARSGASAPSFEEREFSDFRIYTLDQKADVDNNQEKQLSLYPLKNVKYTREYEYRVQGNTVDIFISFKNSTAEGLGVPLPRGNVNFYEIDEKDGTQQFVGVATIANTSMNQDVSLKIGSAFDIIGRTTTTNASNQNNVREADYEVSLTNNKSEAVEVEVIRLLQNVNTEILNPSIPFEKINANTIVFRVGLDPGQERKITFKERIINQ